MQSFPLQINVTRQEDGEHLPIQPTFLNEPENPDEVTKEINVENDAMADPEPELVSCDKDNVEPKFDKIVFQDVGSWLESMRRRL